MAAAAIDLAGYRPQGITGSDNIYPRLGRISRSGDAAKAGIYIVRAGDTLGSIARKVYGSSRHWQRLYELNRDHLSRPSALRVGQQLRTRDEVETPVDPDPVGE